MNELMANDAFKVYLACAGVLTLNLYGLSFATGILRGKHKSPATPEDARKGANDAVPDPAPEIARLKRAHTNAVENIPAMLLVALIYLLAGATGTMFSVLMGIITVSRLMHTFFYLRAMQPWRTLCYLLALIASGVMVGHLIWKSFCCCQG